MIYEYISNQLHYQLVLMDINSCSELQYGATGRRKAAPDWG